MAEMLVKPRVLACCTDSIESTAFLRTTHLCSARNSAPRPAVVRLEHRLERAAEVRGAFFAFGAHARAEEAAT